MKFIKRLSDLAKREDNNGMRILFEELAQDPATSSTRLKGFGSIAETKDIYFFLSEGEAALILVDTDGSVDELADEERFEDQEPLWFTENSHRISPFSQIKSLMEGFITTIRAFGHSEMIEDYLCVLISNTHIINYDDYYQVFEELKGAVFHAIKDIKREILVSNGGKAEELVSVFRNCCRVSEELQSLFEPYDDIVKNPKHPDVEPFSSDTSWEYEPIQIEDMLSKKEIMDFVDDDDPDFKTTEEAVNPETGEKITVKKNTELPAVTILEPIVNPQPLLDEMVGLHDLKRNINEIVAYAKYSKRVKMAYPKLAQQSINLHTIIMGNPGTGKTTMCRIYGGLLHSAGILSRGHTVIATRSSFIGQNFGTEELRVNQCLKLAQGGCLFIDEAAQLFTNPHPHDPGRNVIQLMLQLLAEEDNRDIAVVLALYGNDKSLERLYELNPGIKSRFVNVLSFPDYTLDELFEIALLKAKAQGMTFTAKAWKKFSEVLGGIFEAKDKNFANGREVVNLLQRCVIKHAVRCEKNGVTGPDLLRLTVHDIADMPEPLVISRKLGFK